MAPQVIPYLGGRKLESFATGLAEGIGTYANRKLQQINKRRRKKSCIRITIARYTRANS